MTRPCNTQDCKNSVKPVHELKKTIVEPPVLKVQVVSERKQRFEFGVLKEGDLDWMREDMQTPGDKPRFPVRVVLNNRTLTVFESSHYDTVAFSVNLRSITSIEKHPDDPKACFVVNTDDNKRIVLCAMRGDSSNSAEIIKNEWVKQIFFFKDHVDAPLEIKVFEDDDITKIKKHELQIRMEEEANARMEEERTKTVIHSNEYKVKQADSVAINAISKELRYEALMTQEMRL